MEQHHAKPEPLTALPIVRHDGWTGEKIATFCEALAETAVVTQACDAAGMGISGAYAARRRTPIFAAAWDAALGSARERLADTLLARSMEGNVEQLYRDGELIGERHFLDNRLGLQILRRLDRLSDREFPGAGRSPAHARTADPRKGTQSIDWNRAVNALRTGDDEAVARALALIEDGEVEEVDGAPNLPLYDDDADDGFDNTDRCWWDDHDQCWMTDFPPPPGFTGYECVPYDEQDDDEPYQRACTAEEAAILDADRAMERAAERAKDEQLRDAWFAMLRSEAADPVCSSSRT
jgi:hypothetical protein